MKKIWMMMAAVVLTTVAHAGAVTDTVTTGSQYANQVWYSLPNDEVKSAPKDNWDLAFQIYGYTASILANTQKGLQVFQSSHAVANWANVDTVGIGTWDALHNADYSWDEGALNSHPDGNYDLGWGVYDMNTHYVTGDSVYVMKLANGGAWIKFKMNTLASSSYSFTWANLDGTNEQTRTIAKSNYTGKNFAYFSLANDAALDNEPLSSDWDIVFTKYMTLIESEGEMLDYSVTGVLQNRNVSAVKAYPVADVNNVDFNDYTFQTDVNVIGYDWKQFDLDTYTYSIADSTVYFVQRANGDVWKLIFTGFSGSSTGDFIFSKELVHTAVTGVDEIEKIQSLGVFPNPSKGQFNFVCTSAEYKTTTIRMYDMSGRVVMQENLQLQEGVNQTVVSTSNVQSGVYFLSIVGSNQVQKVIVE
jgi:hypothetical protein